MPSFDMTVITFERLSKFLPINVRSVITRHVSSKDLRWCDIYLCVRGNNPLSAYLCKKANQYGCKLVLMLDDDLLSYKSNQHSFFEKLCKRSLVSIVKMSDIILTPSIYLGEKYKRQFNKNYVVTNTIIDKEDIKDNWSKDNQIRLLYAASHMNSFQKLVLPFLNKLYEKYNDKISLTIIGGKIRLDSIKMPVTLLNSMPYHEYRDYMKTHSFDIGFAPLYETEMSKSKYYNKFLEYSSQGICGIYSQNLPYTQIIDNFENGILVENTSEAWFEATCQLIDEASLREHCIKEAQLQLKRDFSIISVMQKLCLDMPWIAMYKKNNKQTIVFKYPTYPFFLLQELIRRTLKCLV